MAIGRSFVVAAAAALAVIAAGTTGRPARAEQPSQASLDDAFQVIQRADFVDLTHAFGPDIPHWKGFEPETVTTLYTVAKDGFRADRFCHVGQWGTHVDPPAHFHEGLKTVDQLDPRQSILRLVVIDVHDKAAADPDYVLTLDDVKAWEAEHGAVPEGAFVAMRTDWSKRWPDNKAMHNVDAKGVAHYPGWTKEALVYLYETRRIAASGHETTDTDPGIATSKDDYSLESYILGTNHFQIELLANLDKVPQTGALVLVTFPKPQNGSGFPARVVALVPKS